MKFTKLILALMMCISCSAVCGITYIEILKPARETLEPAWAEMPENTNPNLKYFGLYHMDKVIDEVAEFGICNMTKLDARDLTEIAHYYDKGFYIFIMIRHIFYRDDPDSGGNRTILQTDYLERWETAKTELAPYMDKIIGFYVDEPLWGGKTKEAFQTSCQVVRADYPDKKMMSVLAYTSISPDNADYFKYCTDLGYDLYTAWDKDDVRNINTRLETEVAVHNQNIWLIPKCFYDTIGYPNGIFENRRLAPGEDVINWIKGSYEIAVDDHRIIGIYPFAYDDDAYEICLREFFDKNSEHYRKDIKDLYLQIGKAVINNY